MTRSFISIISVLALAATSNSQFSIGAGNTVSTVPGFVNINNFQGNGLNIVNDNNVPNLILNGTAVTTFPSSFGSGSNQRWQFLSTGAPGQFNIVSNFSTGGPWFLSFPTILLPNGNPKGGQPVVFNSHPATFSVTSTNPPNVTITEAVSGFALTGWAQVNGNPGQTTPITLEVAGSVLTAAQVWTIVSA